MKTKILMNNYFKRSLKFTNNNLFNFSFINNKTNISKNSFTKNLNSSILLNSPSINIFNNGVQKKNYSLLKGKLYY